MPLILAIDPDKRQSTQLATLVLTELHAELVHRATAAEALDALQARVPDLVLTSSLISPREDAMLAAHLRDLGAAAAHVQTITIPLLGSAAPQRAKGVLSALRRDKPQTAMTDGCAPDVFAEQIRQYLRTADDQKVAAVAEEPAAEVAFEPAVVAESVVAEAITIEAAPLPEPEAQAAEPLAAEVAAGPPPVSELDDLSIDPVVAQALEELSRRLPAASLADAITAEAPVPIVEMQTFETLDAIASQLAAAPVPEHENLDDLASLFAATPTLLHTAPLTSGVDTPSPGRRHEFESLFAEASASADSAAPIEVPGIDPSLFASSAAQPPSADPPSSEHSLPEFEVLEPAATGWEPLAAADRALAPVDPEPIDEEIALDVDAFDAAVAAPAAEPAAPADTPFSFTFVDGFGDAWSDFEVASVAAAPAPAATPAPEPTVAPVLDGEALSLIGDAAHKASLDAYVIEELGRGIRHVERKATNTHAGATHVAPAAAPAVKKKAPAQDEWGLFDPEQCGFAALEAEDPAERRKAREGTRVRVISY